MFPSKVKDKLSLEVDQDLGGRSSQPTEEKSEDKKKIVVFLTLSVRTDMSEVFQRWNREAGENPARPSHCDRERKLQGMPLT